METRAVKLKRAILLGGDALVLYASLWIAVSLRGLGAAGVRPDFGEHVIPYSAVFALWLLTFAANGLYDLRAARNTLRFFGTFFASLAVAALLAIGFFYLTPFVGIAPKTTLLLHLATFALLFPSWRAAYNALFGGVLLRQRVLFVGDSDEVRELLPALRANPALGYDVAGIILPEGGTWLPEDPPPLTVRGFADFARRVRESRADTVVLGASPRQSPELARQLYESVFLGVRFVDAVSFSETITRRVPVAAITHAWFLENLREAEKHAGDLFKRALDVGLALVGLALCVVLLPIVLLAMLLTQGRPVFFSQVRVGRGGKGFRMWKLRTMVRDAEKDGARFAEKGDPRVTPLGRLLRATRVDELPQLWNVFKGEMSFVGPRPERPEFVAELEREMPFYAMRHLVRPGLTGWAQIEFPYANTIAQNLKKLQYDLYYVKHRGVPLDLFILLRTLNIIVRAKGQ